jgi:hypothetical protein
MSMRRTTMAAAAVITLVLGLGAMRSNQQKTTSRYLYVWGGTGRMLRDGIDMITVIDADPSSRGYGSVIDAVTVDSAGRMPHHTEFDPPAGGRLFVNDFGADKSFVIDFTNPAHPTLGGRVSSVSGARGMHSFARLANGHVLATLQFGDGKSPGDPGGVAELDENGKLLRFTSSADSQFPGARIRTYSIATLPAIDRMITTSQPMGDERTADVVQVWRISDLKLLKTLQVPESHGDSAHMRPFEVRTLSDGRTAMLNTYYCGFYRLTDLDREPKIERVMAMSHNSNFGCSVPAIVGKFMIMPITFAHRYATIDISNPEHPVEVSSLAGDTTFFPHWIAREPGTDRLVVSVLSNHVWKVLIGELDEGTGKFAWDEKFRDAGAAEPGVSFVRKVWPNGVSGLVVPHGTLFVH